MKIRPKIQDLTVICVAGNKHAESIASLYKAKEQIYAARYVLLTNIDLEASGIEVYNVGGLDTWEKYNHFIIKELAAYFDTEYCLIVQWDGIILNGQLWSDDFLKFDYIGAAWLDGECGNGGFSIRSKRLMDIVANDDFIEITTPEDVCLCQLYKRYLQNKYNITYAPKEVCDRFSFELNPPKNHTFGKHAFHHEPYKETVVIKRSMACGDVVMCEPLLHYYHKKGYRVVLDTQPEFYKVYFQHYFPVWHKSQLPEGTKYTEINLDYAYEINPKQLVLQSYYDIAGIKDGEIRNARLNVVAGEGQKMFHKYALIHIDSTGMEYRNQHGIEWGSVVKFLESNGYTVFQIGKRVEYEVATYLNTMNLEFMMFLMKGADLLIGLDSGPAQVAVGLGVPSVIMFGSVNPAYRYPDMKNIRVVQSPCCKPETQHCYHNKVDLVGNECIYDQEYPPCTQYTSTQIINQIKDLWLTTAKQTRSERY